MNSMIMLTAVLLSSNLALGHADHAPKVVQCAAKECTQPEIEKAIPSVVEKLAASGKVSTSWTTAKIEKVEQKQFKKGPEWVATLIDEKQADEKKKRLYVFITTKGTLNGSNFTGN